MKNSRNEPEFNIFEYFDEHIYPILMDRKRRKEKYYYLLEFLKFEFLRRNEAYQADWEDYQKDPSMEHLETLKQKWSLRSVQSPYEPLAEQPITVFHRDISKRGYRVTAFKDGEESIIWGWCDELGVDDQTVFDKRFRIIYEVEFLNHIYKGILEDGDSNLVITTNDNVMAPLEYKDYEPVALQYEKNNKVVDLTEFTQKGYQITVDVLSSERIETWEHFKTKGKKRPHISSFEPVIMFDGESINLIKEGLSTFTQNVSPTSCVSLWLREDGLLDWDREHWQLVAINRLASRNQIISKLSKMGVFQNQGNKKNFEHCIKLLRLLDLIRKEESLNRETILEQSRIHIENYKNFFDYRNEAEGLVNGGYRTLYFAYETTNQPSLLSR